MSNLPEQPAWESGIHQLEESDRAKAGPGGILNLQAGQLANRTRYLKTELDAFSGLIKSGELPFSDESAAQDAINAGQISEGSLFSVRSQSSKNWVDEYKNVNGVATPTGKSLPDASSLTPTVMTTTDDPDGTQAGLSLTTSGQFFLVMNGAQDETDLLTLYRNNDGLAEKISDFVSEKKLSSLLKVNGDGQFVFQFVDKLGFSQFDALITGEFGNKRARVKPDGLVLDGFSIIVTEGDGVYFQDPVGQRIYLIDKKGLVAPRSMRTNLDGSFGSDAATVTEKGVLFNNGIFIDITGPEFLKCTDFLGQEKVYIDQYGKPVGFNVDGAITLQDKIDILNAGNLNYYSKIRSRYNTSIEGLVFARTLILEYGQSLRSAQQGFPALSDTPYENLGNLMLGDSPRPNSRTAAYFTPVGDPELKPLKAVVQTSNGAATMTPEEVSELPADAPNEGEGGVAALNMFRALWLRHISQLTDPSRSLILANASVNGRTIEQLSKGASPELYNRIREAVTKIKAIADTDEKTFGIGAILFDQGQFNYNPGYGGDGTRDGWKSLFLQLYSDIVTDFCSGQNPPAVFMSQTGASYTSDTNELAIGMAQLDLVTEGGNFYGSATTYQIPDKNGHLTSNGYRWRDMYDAKAMFRVLVLGEGCEPLHCISAEVTDNYALLNYAVPYPPLQWGTPYVGRTATTYADKGYRATDDNGALPITAAEIVADTVVKLIFSRKSVGTVKIWYADKTAHNGNGCLKDSDPFIATENYVYTEGSGQWADENIPELVGKPYPLQNWAWAQVITTTVEAE